MVPKYKSTAIVYPVNIYAYSKESTSEQMLQVFNSNDIKEKMLAAFNLANHYKLDKKDPQFYTYFLGEYSDNVSISKTEFESIEIKVLDTDPKTASNMVDSLITFYDNKTAEMHRKKQLEVITISTNQFNIKIKELDSLEKLLSNIRQTYGIMNYTSQVTEATKGELSGNNAAKELFKKLQLHGVEYQKLDSMVFNIRKEYLFNKYTLETAEKEYNKKISYSQVVSSPYPADKKSYPVRWAVVAITVITSLIFSLIVIALIDSKRKKA
jgi:capsule polysaccharide export protein KpsE/RkpR